MNAKCMLNQSSEYTVLHRVAPPLFGWPSQPSRRRLDHVGLATEVRVPIGVPHAVRLHVAHCRLGVLAKTFAHSVLTEGAVRVCVRGPGEERNLILICLRT